MKNILNFDEFGEQFGFFPHKERPVRLTKQEGRLLWDDLLETFGTLLDVLNEYNMNLKLPDLADKRDMIKTHYMKLQTIAPLAGNGWEKFAVKPSTSDMLGGNFYDLEDVFLRSRNIFQQYFSSAERNRDLRTPYFLYVLKKEPERWKEIYLESRKEGNPTIALVEIFRNITPEKLQKKIAQEEERFIRNHFAELLGLSGPREEGPLCLHAFPWLARYYHLIFEDSYRPEWEDKLSYQKVWPMVTVSRKTFDAYWAGLDEHARRKFIYETASLYSDGCSHNDSGYNALIRLLEDYSDEEKEQLAEYFPIHYASLPHYNKHLWWVSRENGKRLDFLKRHTPFHNGLSDGLLGYYSGSKTDNGCLMTFIGTDKEVLNEEELATYVQWLVDEHGRDSSVKEAVEHYKAWLADQEKLKDVPK